MRQRDSRRRAAAAPRIRRRGPVNAQLAEQIAPGATCSRRDGQSDDEPRRYAWANGARVRAGASVHDLMTSSLPAIAEWRDVTRDVFDNEILPRNEPAILRGLVAGWPAVKRARESALSIAKYLAALDNGTPVDALMTPPEEEGRIFYDASMAGFNYLRTLQPVSRILEQALRYAQFPRAPAVAVQSALIARCMPGFKTDNVLPLLDSGIEPRLWVGTAIVTPAHFDESHNIACCVAGRRRFTLFPIEQIENLYIGPLDHAPTGTPMSLVDFAKPDFERFPRFREALAHARVAELIPGDAIYMPPLWWHHVRSLEPFNMLVNYWWMRAAPGHAAPPSALDGLLHAVAALRGLPPAQRQAWRTLFEYYVFDTERDVTSHIPAERRGVLGDLSTEQHAQLRALLVQRLNR